MEPKYIKPTVYAKKVGLNYRTIVRHYYEGSIEGYIDDNKRIYLLNPDYKSAPERSSDNRVVLYARVSSTANKASLDGQIERMRLYAAAKGYTVVKEIKEIASGLNDNRKKLLNVLSSDDWDILLVEHKDRLTRFGYNYFSILERLGQRVEVINTVDNKDSEIMDDFISIVTSFCGRIYGANRKKKTEEIIDNIKEK
jgi:putative resolvase